LNKVNNRILWIDVIKVFSIFSVLFLHSAAPLLDAYGEIEMNYWHIGNIYDSAVRMAVPLFFMITGTLLLNSKEEPLSIFFRKRVIKVVIPLIAWSIIYILFRKYVRDQDINILIQLLKTFVTPRYFHLWFLYAIIGIYLVVPILKIFINHSSKKMQVYFLILWIFSFSLVPLVSDITHYKVPNYIPMMSGYIGFLIMGYLLSNLQISKMTFYMSVLFSIFSTLLTIFGTIYLSEKSNEFISTFYHYSSISTIIQVAAYFIFLKYISEKFILNFTKTTSYIYLISFASLGIYLVHPIILYLLKEIGIYALNGYDPLYMVPLTAIVTYICSFIIVLLMQQIPLLKQIVPK